MSRLAALVVLLVCALPLGAATRTAAEAYALALDAEVMRGDLPRALELLREAARAPAGELKNDALIATARVLLRQEDMRAFNQALAALPPPRGLTTGQAAEVARLKRARDEQAREPRRPAPSPAPSRGPRDISFTEAPLEDAAVSLSNLYGVTIVASGPPTTKLNLHLKSVSLHQALLALVFHTGLDARRAAGIYYVGPARRLIAQFAGQQTSTAAELFAEEAVSRAKPTAASVTLELESVLVAEALRRLVEGFGVNVVGAASAQKVSLDFSRVGLDGALRSIASQLGWEIRRVNDMFFVGPGSHLAQYFPGFERRYLRLRHVSAGEIYDQVQEFLGHEKLRLARVEVDIVGNALIIEGDKVDLDKVERFLAQEDVTQQSVSVELYLKDYRTALATESPRKRIRMLAGQMGIVTLEAEGQTEGSVAPLAPLSIAGAAPSTGTSAGPSVASTGPAAVSTRTAAVVAGAAAVAKPSVVSTAATAVATTSAVIPDFSSIVSAASIVVSTAASVASTAPSLANVIATAASVNATPPTTGTRPPAKLADLAGSLPPGEPLAAPPPPPPPRPVNQQLQLMVEITPRLKAASQVSFDLVWRLTTLRGGQIVDVKEGTPARVTTSLDAPLEVAVLVEKGVRKLALVMRPVE